MNARLKIAVEEANAVLSSEDQDQLADIVATYIANRATEPEFTDAELAEMKRRYEEPFDPAPDHEVRAFFKKYGG